MARYGYARVSTNGQSLEDQITKLEQEGCTEIFSEKFTGTKMNRPEFNKLMSLLEAGDTLIVTKLDRFARSADEGKKIIKGLMERGIRVHILNMGLIEDTPTGRLILTIFTGFAEFERDMIVQRTQEGKAYARKHNPNFKEGRPTSISIEQKDHAMKLLTEEKLSYTEVAKRTGISRATIYREAAKRGLTLK